MNQTKQEAADRYVSKEVLKVMGKMSAGYAGGLLVGFKAGAEWAELKWIPVTERLPEDNGRYICVTADDTWIVGEYEHNYIFCDPSGCSWRCKLWCPIPDSLLNFKP